MPKLSYVRLYSDGSGESHFELLEIEMHSRDFAPPAPSFSVSAFAPAAQYGFLHVPRGWVGDLHPSPLRMWVFVLSGEMDFEASDGEHRSAVPGSVMLLEDTNGKGHRSRVVGGAPAVLAVVRL